MLSGDREAHFLFTTRQEIEKSRSHGTAAGEAKYLKAIRPHDGTFRHHYHGHKYLTGSTL